jgi:hypothetical protein
MATVGTRCKRVPCALVVVDSAFSYGIIPRLRKSVTEAARRISSLGRLGPATGIWPLFAPYNAFKSVSSVRELDEFEGVYRGAPFSLRPLQRKHQLHGAGSTAAHQNSTANGKGGPDDHPDRSEVHETEHEANNHCRSDDRARSSSQHEPSAALDRLSEFLNTNLKLLDLLRGRESGF